MIDSILNLLPYQLIVVGMALLWVDFILPLLDLEWLNRKPTNCTLCLTFWGSLMIGLGNLCLTFWGSLMLGLGNLSVLTSLEFIYLITVTPLLLRYIEARL